MGESYRGLTVKFGGDTTSLQKALKSATYTISATQSEMNKLKSALKFDPSSVLALSAKMDLLQERASAAYQKIHTMRSAVGNLSDEDVLALVKGFDNINNNVSDSVRRIDSLNNALKETKDKINNMSEFTVFGKNGKELDGALSKFENINSECATLAQHYRTLAAEWKNASAVMNTAKEKSQLQDLATELIKLQSETKQIRQEFLNLQGLSVFDKADSSAEQFNASLKEVDTTISLVENEGKKLQESLQIDPHNIEIAKGYISSAKDEISQLNAKAEILQKRLESIGANGIKELSQSASEVRANFVKTADDLSKVSSYVGQASAKLSSMRAELTSMLANGQENTQEYKNLQNAISKTESNLSQLIAKQKEAKEAFDTAQACTEYRKLQTELTETKAKAAAATNEFENLGKAAKVNASTFTTLGMALSMNITPHIMMFGSYAIQAAEDIDAAYRDMRKTVSGTEEDFENLKQSAMDFASTNVTSADQILEIQAMGGQLGLAVDELESFSTTIANLNVATNITDASEAAQMLGQLANIMNDLNAETFPNFGDALVRLGNNNAALESDILDVTSRIGSMGSILGFTSPQLLAWSTAIAATGQNSEAAGTAISNTMSDIETAVSSGGESLESFASVAGKSAEEFAAMWKSSPSDALKSFIEGLERIKNEGGSVDGTLESLGITAVRQKQALEGLTQTVGGLDDSLQMSQDAWDGVSDQWGDAGDAANEASKKAQGFSGQLSILQNNAQMLGAEFAESLAPVLVIVNAAMQTLYEITKTMPDSVKLLILALVGLVAVVGPISTVVGPVVNVIRQLSSDSATAGRSISSAAKQMETAGKTAKATATGFATLKTAAASLGAALAVMVVVEAITKLADMYEQEQKLIQSTTALTDAFKNVDISKFTDASDEVVDSSSKVSEAISSNREEISALKTSINEAAESHISLAETISDKWGQVKANESLVDSYADTIKQLSGNCEGSAEKMDALKTAVDGYNSITGSTLTITDDINGTLEGGIGILDENTEAWKRNAEAQAKQELYQDIYRQKYEDLQNVTTASKEYSEAVENLNAIQEEYDNTVILNSGQQSEWTAKIMGAQKAVDDARESLENATGQYEDSAEALAEVESGMDSSSESLERFDESLEVVSEKLGITKDAVIELAASFNVSGEEGIAKFAEAINAGFPEAQAAILATTDMTEAEFNQARDSVGSAGQEAMNRYIAALQSGYSPSEAAAYALESGVQSALESGIDPAGSAASSTSETYASDIDSASGTAIGNAASMARGVESNLDVSSEAGGIGSNISSSFASNILSHLQTAWKNAYDLAKKAIEGLQSGSDTHSPSRAAIKVAKQVAKEGFVDEFPKYYDEAYESAKKLGQSAISGLESEMSAGLSEVEQLVGEGISSLYTGSQQALTASIKESLTVNHQIPNLISDLSKNNNAKEVGQEVSNALKNTNLTVMVDGRELSKSTAGYTDTQLATIKARRSR